MVYLGRFRSKHYCYMCEEGFNSLKMIEYAAHSFCSKRCLDKYKEFIREFLKEWIEVYNPFWTAEQILKQLEGED